MVVNYTSDNLFLYSCMNIIENFIEYEELLQIINLNKKELKNIKKEFYEIYNWWKIVKNKYFFQKNYKPSKDEFKKENEMLHRAIALRKYMRI